YVVTTLGGVWKSANGGPWQQLHGSPPGGSLTPPVPIDVDPANSSHVVVGGPSGAWETTDGGSTWMRILDPVSLGCKRSFVYGVTFSPSSTLHLGVDCGIARRQQNGQWKLTPTASPVTAMVSSQTTVWARTTTSVVFSTDDGDSWSKEIHWPNSVSIQFNEFDSLGVVDGFAYMVSGGNDVGSQCGRDNHLLVFSAQGSTFSEQSVMFLYQNKLTNSCNGTGPSNVTGHAFVKSFVRKDNAPVTVGNKLQLFYCAGQEILQADGINADGTVTSWTWIMGTQGYTNRDPVHADPWDFLIDT